MRKVLGTSGGYLKEICIILVLVWFFNVDVVAGEIANVASFASRVEVRSSPEIYAPRRWGRNSDANLELHYYNKRRVPKGPDPIHNRRAARKSRDPNGRS